MAGVVGRRLPGGGALPPGRNGISRRSTHRAGLPRRLGLLLLGLLLVTGHMAVGTTAFGYQAPTFTNGTGTTSGLTVSATASGFTTTIGTVGDPVVVRGTSPALLGWLTGRSGGEAVEGAGTLRLPSL